MNKAEQIELLDDLLHDLGKYIAFPLNMLPSEPDGPMFQDAVEHALNQTRVGAQGSQSAKSIWANFLNEAGNAFDKNDCWQPMHDAVEAALAWGAHLGKPTLFISRKQVTDDIKAVSAAIRRLRDQING